MNVKWAIFVIVFILCACKINRAPMDARHATRTQKINAEYNAKIVKNQATWKPLEDRIRQQKKLLVPMQDGKPVKTVEDGLKNNWEACFLLPKESLEKCKKEVRSMLYKGIGKRYFMADIDAAFEEWKKNSDSDLETLTAISHNKRLKAQIVRRLGEIKKSKREFADMINKFRKNELQWSAERRDREIRNAQRRRNAAIADALQDFGNSLQQTSRTSSSSAAHSSGCTSDYSCGVGQKCVKNRYSGSGVCMRAVNEFGTPTNSLPDPGSVGPNIPDKNDCSLGRVCPPGFRCDYASGACIQ